MRAFNRFYTNLIGALDYSRHLHTPYTLTEARVLYELVHATRADAADLRSALSVDAGQLSRMLARFEERGLVSRRPSARDARRVEVELTAEGREAAGLLEERSQSAVESLMDGMAGADRERLARSLRTARRILEDRGTRKAKARPVGTAPAEREATGHGPAKEEAAARVRIRGPRPGDLGWIVERNAAVYAEEFGWDGTYEALVARIVAGFAAGHDPEREAVWIAELDGRRAGCVMCVDDTAEDAAEDAAANPAGDEGTAADGAARTPPHTARLRLLLVDPSARGHGVGDRLVAECVDFARAAGYRELVLWTNDVLAAARRIYQRAGFELLGEDRHHSFGHDLTGQDWRLVL
ncbi:GNAT family N-acetyltransferase [Streptomyces sp. HNM0575]|uniref:bifunctional helix-turn-helix transcriptional regulator/GNAT family N-acetyltransferase n=1 Tax=Streptomyces sp. HNM0575 TaxID=2716338 RepID=UPI00145D5F4D|nr:bifunctional helix-turn-helix transcriptional regulator/GNAT family N-acetyltransferase [Streptomyces sp. HNM0575]NLU72134.1 GNAT family N-acetyltransferase [Streptomyces sp. HNM0575]